MTIAYDSAVDGGSGATPHTEVINVGVAPNRIIVAGISWRSNVETLVSFTIGGVAATLLATADVNDGTRKMTGCLYYLVAPPTGAVNMTLTLSGGVNNWITGVCYSGVDQASPWLGAAVSDTLRTDLGAGNVTCTVPSQTGNLVVDAVLGMSQGSSWIATMDVSQTQRNYTAAGVGGGSVGGGQSEKAGAVSVDMIWTQAANDGETVQHAASLQPYVAARIRAVRYFFNIWDPTHVVRDGQGARLEPNEIQADEWIQADGYLLGEPRAYTDFVPDPSKSRIVSKTYRRDGVDIKASKSQFADVIVARAAAGRM